ncbi:MAG: sulfatase family protein [Candidatus Latescibacterota bacterium]
MIPSRAVNRRRLLKWGMAGMAAATASSIGNSRPAPGAEKKPPNIVLIVSDDHGGGDLGCWGHPVVKTPNLDRLAREGTRFTHAFCTTASCSPSRSVILSGQHNHANGMYGLQHSYHHFQSFDTITSLPVQLSRKGYRTCRAGKFHVAPEPVYHFETALSDGEANNMQALGRSPVEMAETCRGFITAQDKRPFFLYFATDDPHRGIPFDTWPGPNPFGNRPEGYPGVKPVTYNPEKTVPPPFLPDTPECRAELAEYYQSISRMDQGVGTLLGILREAGVYDNTVILYISDNGIAFPGAKTTLYEPGMRLPCIARTPGQARRGIASDAMISWVDITPTLLDLAGGLPEDATFQGRSFAGAIDTEHVSGFDEVYGSHTFHEVTMYYPMRVIRTRRFKLIRNLAHEQEFPFAADLRQSSAWQSVVRRGLNRYGRRTVEAYLRRPEWELYDLTKDPHEVNNLAGKPECRKDLNALQSKLGDFGKRTRDPWTGNIGL